MSRWVCNDSRAKIIICNDHVNVNVKEWVPTTSVNTSSLGVLTPDLETPVVSESPVESHLLEVLEVVPQLRVEVVWCDLEVLAVLGVLLSVEEPGRDLELAGVGQHCRQLVHLLNSHLTSSAGGMEEIEKWMEWSGKSMGYDWEMNGIWLEYDWNMIEIWMGYEWDKMNEIEGWWVWN